MHIVLLEPFYTGSHQTWVEQLVKHSSHEYTVLSMRGRYWKWRMHGGAVTLAQEFRKQNLKPDLLLASDMLDLSTFLALTRDLTAGIPVAVYFHENQMSYPWGQRMQRHNNWRHYSFINYTTALSADRVFFNSHYHKQSFLEHLPELLNSYPDHNEPETVETIRAKSEVLPLGLDLTSYDAYQPSEDKPSGTPPLLLWNHRWEEDKNPKQFARLLMDLYREGYDFRVALLGESPYGGLDVFEELKATLGDKVLQYGYAESFADYARWLWQADLLPVTSNQDFFGGSVVEALYCNCYPVLPNRLAYPEHVPEEAREDLLYAGYEHLLERMKYLLSNISKVQDARFQHWVAGYDWSEMIAQYDRALEHACMTLR